jgi:2-polyprenyl-6-methoxyphenol hydroxylase-like FAD-dependent oxidoreductase
LATLHVEQRQPSWVDVSTANRVLIIGAGPGGKTLALALRRVGIKSDLYERVREFKPLGVGIGVQTNAMRGLLKLGIGSQLFESGGIVEWQEMYSTGGALLARLPLGELGRETGMPGLTVLRRDYENLVLGQIDPATLHLGHECIGIEQDHTGVTAHFANGESARGALLVGADGLHSYVRKYVVGEAPPRYSGFTIWRGVAELPAYPFDSKVMKFWIGSGLQIQLAPIPGPRICWSVAHLAPQGGVDPPGGILAAVLEIVKDLPEMVSDCIRATDEAVVQRNDLVDRDPIKKFVTGRVVLMGDAAHPTTPFLGQGLGLSIEDAIILAKELSLTAGLSDTDVIPLALQTYERSRLERAATIVLASRRRGEQMADANTFKRVARERAMRFVPAKKWRAVVDESAAYEV